MNASPDSCPLTPMPILKCEPDVFPDDLFAGDPHELGEDSWWAMYTLPRREKELVRQLRARQIVCYCPLIAHRTRSPAGRQRQAYLPLFSSYVFVRGDELQRHEALTTNCVSRCLPVPDGARLYRDLGQIWQLIQSGMPLTPEERLLPGQRVAVRCGSLAGMEGTILRRQGQSRLIVAVNFLQRGASVALDDCEVIAV